MPHRIALFAPPSQFYETMLSGLADGFIALGHECVWRAELPPQSAVAAFAKQSGITLVLEINRTLKQDQPWPAGVAHAAWLQDHWIDGNLVVDLGKSDHLYFLYHADGYYPADLPPDRRWSVLHPGARLDALAPLVAADRYDFSFCGHLPSPLDPKMTMAIGRDGSPVSLEKFVESWPASLTSQSGFCLRAIRQRAKERCAELDCEMIFEQHTILDESIVRISERRTILGTALGVSKNLGIWGPPKWRKWPEFKPYYHGELPPAALDAEVYQASRINIHNGIVPMHVRSMDCMAAGGFILINRTWLDDKPYGINHFLGAGEHYASYGIDDFADVAQRYLRDRQARERIAAEGRRAVLSAHTWKHRAAQIIRDFS